MAGGAADTAGTVADGTVIIDSSSAAVLGVLRHSAHAVLLLGSEGSIQRAFSGLKQFSKNYF
jgi:hypothetical protein